MKNIKTLAASIASFTTVATMGIGCISASAMGTSTNTKVYTAAEEQFIMSYESQGYSDVAEYFVNNMEISDAQDMMELYIDGKNKIASTKSSRASGNGPFYTGKNFYSTTNLSSNNHYGIVITDNGSATTVVSMRLQYDPSWIGFSSPLSKNMLNQNSDMSVVKLPSEDVVTMAGTVIANKTTNTPSGLLEVPFNVSMTSNNVINGETFSEGTLYHKFSFSRLSSTPLDGDSTFCYETYVQGDVNHDGKLDSTDIAYLTDFNTGDITNLSFYYTDMSYNIAKIINDLAIDANKDGSLGIADILWIQHHLD